MLNFPLWFRIAVCATVAVVVGTATAVVTWAVTR